MFGARTRDPVTVAAPRTRVIVVDDDTLQLRAQERMLRDAPVDLMVADNAIDALLHIGATKPDLVIMDVFMPGLDGMEACRRIRANAATRDIRVILASATMTPDLEAAAQQAGASGAVGKPVDIRSLIEPPRAAAVEVVPSRETMRGADLLVTMLAEAGVEVVFGIPGGAIAPVHDALMDSLIQVVTNRHESGSMFAAAGYAHTTGRLGVAAVTSGPGALNALTGLASAWCDGLPVLLLVGEVAGASQGKGVLQDGSAHGLQIVEMARYITKLSVEVQRPSMLAPLLRRAITTALSGRKGPVLLTLPFDVTTGQVSRPRTGGSITIGGMVETQTIDEIASLLTTAARPLILAGSGVRGGGAPQRLRTVAERLSCPVTTTPKAKGVFPESHPLSLGVLGLGGHRSPRAYLESGVDVVVAIGTSLSELATDGFSSLIQAPRALVHVDIEARQIGKSYSPTHAVLASAAEFLGGLSDRLGERPSRALHVVPARLERHALPSSIKPSRIASHDALREIQHALPESTIFTIDSGEHFSFSTHFLEIDHPDAYVVMTGLGSMGQSIGAAIGAQLAHPGRSVAAICGDGCFAMNAFEIATAVQAGLPIRVFVFNDGHLGMVEKGNSAVYGRTPDYATTPLDVCSVARGLGATTFKVDGAGQLRDAAEALRSIPGPVVVDVRIDHEISLPKNGRVAALAKTSSLGARPSEPSMPRIPGVMN